MNESALFVTQVSANALIQNLFYLCGVLGALLVMTGLLLFDMGSVKKGMQNNAIVEKLVAFFIGFSVYVLIGFSFWMAQYYLMSGGTFVDSVEDWWAGGALANQYAQKVSSEHFPQINNSQIFVFFLACFAGIINVLLHFSVSGRMKASAFYITAVVTTLMSSLLSWWSWGSVGPLTQLGFHDFFGVGYAYLFPAGMAGVFVYKLKPKAENFSSSNSPSSAGFTLVALFFIFCGLSVVSLSCLFFFSPGMLAVSVTMADTSVGIVLNNYGAAWAGGALMGAVLAYHYRNYCFFVLGPFAGHLAGASGYDVYLPWQIFLIAAGGAIVACSVAGLLNRYRIDEQKLIPLFAGAGSYGLIMVGLLKSGTPRGGYIGIEEGAFAFQHGEVGIVMQLIGIVVCIGMGMFTAWVLSIVLEHTIGMQVSEEDQEEGLDKVKWDIGPDVDFDAKVPTKQ